GTRLEREAAGLFYDLGDASRVVDGAIIDIVAVGVGLPDAEMVPVRRVDDRLVRVFLARQQADDVVRRDRADVRVRSRTDGGLEVDGLEIATFSGRLGCLEVEAGAAEQLGCDIALDPRLEGRVASGGVLADDIELSVGV